MVVCVCVWLLTLMYISIHIYDQLQSTVTKVPATEIPILVGDWNGHVGADAGAYNEVHGGHGFGARNSEGESILEEMFLVV